MLPYGVYLSEVVLVIDLQTLWRYIQEKTVIRIIAGAVAAER